MPSTQEETPFYIRTAGGNTYYLETLEEALAQFVSEDGYRLSLGEGETRIVIRREDWTEGDWSTRSQPQKMAKAEIMWWSRR